MSNPKAIILDIDGTLVDSNDSHAKAWVEAMHFFEYNVAFNEVRPYIGMGGDKLLPATIGVQKNSDTGKGIAETRRSIYTSSYLPEVVPFRDVRALVERLLADGYKVIAASSGRKEEVEANLKVARIDDLVGEYLSSDDADESKPAPDILQAALNKLGIEAEYVVMIGDSPYDIQAAQKLNMPIVALRCGGFSEQALNGATAIYDDPADLLNRYETTIFAR